MRSKQAVGGFDRDSRVKSLESQVTGAVSTTTERVDPVLTKRRRLRSDVLLTFASKAIVGLGALGASVVAARELGPSGRGLMAVALTLSLTLMQVGHLGLVSANPYFVARNPKAVPQVISNSLAWAAILGATLIGAVVALKLALSDFLPGLGWPVTMIALLILPAALAALLLQAILLGEGRMLAYSLPQAVLSLATVAGLFTVAKVSHLTVAGAVAVMIAQWIVAVPVYYALAARGAAKLPTPDFVLARQMISYALRVYAATVLSFLVIRFDFFLVNTYLGARQAGLYSVVAGIAEGMFLLPVAIGMNIFFRIAQGGEGQLTLIVFRSTLVIYGAFCLIAAALAGTVIPLLFGEAFGDSVTLFYCLLPGIFSFGMLTILSNHLLGQGYPREAIWYWAFGLALNVALNVAFLSELGTYFAAVASSITYAVIFALHVRLFSREVGWPALRPRIGDVASVGAAVLGKRAD